MRPSTAPFAVVALAALSTCATYGDRHCDELDTTTCDRPVVQARFLRDYRHDDRARRPVVGSPVDVRNVVVSAVDRFIEPRSSGGSADSIWVQEVVTDPTFTGCAPHPAGRVCGVQLFAPRFIPAGTFPLEGDIVNVAGGTYDEFNCQPCRAQWMGDRTLPELSRTNVERVGSTRAPEPIAATIQQILEGGDRYVGVLVRLTHDVVTESNLSGFGEIQIGSGVNVTNAMTNLVNPANNMPILEGTTIRNLTGIVSYFDGTKIIPRRPSDFEVVTP